MYLLSYTQNYVDGFEVLWVVLDQDGIGKRCDPSEENIYSILQNINDICNKYFYC